MSGHSKWHTIKHKKGAADAKRGKVFTRLIKEITVAARLGGGDPGANPRLRLAMDKATDQNMPKDTIERAIKRGSGGLEGVHYDEVRYEGYGINGAAVIVDCMTDNRTRTVADVRHAFSKYGGNLGTDGSVAFLFKHCGQMVFAPGVDENALMEAAAVSRMSGFRDASRYSSSWARISGAGRETTAATNCRPISPCAIGARGAASTNASSTLTRRSVVIRSASLINSSIDRK